MHCRDFRAQHCAFVDDTLSAVDMRAMRAHLEVCAGCAGHDTRVRRSLMVVRSAPRLECSPDFSRRLHARLQEIGPVDRCGTQAGPLFPTGHRNAMLVTGLALATAFATIAALTTLDDSLAEIRVEPVVAVAPPVEQDPAVVATPAYVASLMSGMPVLPAVMAAGQSSLHMANVQFQLTGYR